MSELEAVYHLVAPETPENKWVNVFCPAKKEFTFIGISHSADGMEVDACKACYEPEPELRSATQEELDAIAEQLNDNA